MSYTKKKSFIITFEPFGLDILVCLGGSKTEAAAKYFKLVGYQESFEVEDNERSRGVVLSVGKGQPKLLWLHETAWAGTIAHEVFHAVYLVLNEKETPLNDTTEEVYAYSIQWLFNRIVTEVEAYKNCDKCLRRKKKKGKP